MLSSYACAYQFMCVYQQCCVTTSDVSYVRRCNALITFGNYYHLYQNGVFSCCHFDHFDLLFVLNMMSHFVLTNSFVYILYQQCCMYLKRRFTYLSLSATIIACIYSIINEIIYSCHFHNFDLLSVSSFCVFFVQSLS